MVAHPYVLPCDLVGIVQRGPRYRRSGKLDGLQLGDGRKHPRATDLHRNALHDRLDALRRILVRARPPRTVRGCPERGIEASLVQLHHRPVDLKAERVAKLLKLVYRRKHFVHGCARP